MAQTIAPMTEGDFVKLGILFMLIGLVGIFQNCTPFEAADLAQQSNLRTLGGNHLQAPAGQVWVYRSDNSLSQFPDGGASTDPSAVTQPMSTSLASAQAVLQSLGVHVYSSAKQLQAQLPFSLPIDPSAALRGGNGSLHPGDNVVGPNLNPSPLSSGVVNSFLIDTSAASSAHGFTEISDTNSFFPAEDCTAGQAILAFGQSNSANSGGTGSGTLVTPDLSGQILMFFNGYCYPARDPLLGASIWNGGASVWLQLGKIYAANNPGQKIVLVPFGVGSSGSWEWAQGGQFYQRLNSIVQQVKSAHLNVTKIFWHQGETDGENASTQTPGVNYSYYTQNFNNIRENLNSQLPGVPIYVAIGTYVSSLPYLVSREIQDALFDLVTNNPQAVHLGAVSDYLASPYRNNAGPGGSQFVYASSGSGSFDDAHFSYFGMPVLAQQWYASAFTNSDATAQLMQGLIETYLGRAPMNGEVAMLESLGSASAAANFIKASDEYFIRDTLYRQYAHRLPEGAGYTYWLAQLKSSGRAVVQNSFASSIANFTAAQTPSGFKFVQQPSGWWGGAFNYLAPIHDAGAYFFNETSGFWELIGQQTLPQVLSAPSSAIVTATPVQTPVPNPVAIPIPTPAATQAPAPAPVATPAPTPAQTSTVASSAPLQTTARNVINAYYIAIFMNNQVALSYWLSGAHNGIGDLSAGSVLSNSQMRTLAETMIASQSQFFSQTYGGMSNTGFATSLYVNLAGSADQSGVPYWANLQSAGESRADVAADFTYAMISTNLQSQPAGMSASDYAAAVQRQQTCYQRIQSLGD